MQAREGAASNRPRPRPRRAASPRVSWSRRSSLPHTLCPSELRMAARGGAGRLSIARAGSRRSSGVSVRALQRLRWEPEDVGGLLQQPARRVGGPHSRPSMSIPLRPVKCSRPPMRCAGHHGLGQRQTTPPSSRTAAVPHTGQADGISHTAPGSIASITTALTISGITSPARCSTTVRRPAGPCAGSRRCCAGRRCAPWCRTTTG